MSKWVQFYHKINKFDLVNMRFTDDVSVVENGGHGFCHAYRRQIESVIHT